MQPKVQKRTRIAPRTGLVCLGLLAANAVHAALPACGRALGNPVPVVQGAGMLESLVFDGDGRLLFTDISAKTVNVIARQGAAPTVLAGQISVPGGLALGEQREVYVGSSPNVLTPFFPSLGKSSLIRIDLDTGAKQTHVTGLSMGNGVVRTRDGHFYASDDLAASLDRVLPDKTVQRTWLKQQSNGLALSADEQTLFINQSLPAKILALDLRTGQQRVLLPTPEGEYFSFLDGLTIDSTGTLYAAAYLSGDIWRISPSGQACILASGFKRPSALAFGRPEKGFASTSLYVTTHSGQLLELPGVLESRP